MPNADCEASSPSETKIFASDFHSSTQSTLGREFQFGNATLPGAANVSNGMQPISIKVPLPEAIILAMLFAFAVFLDAAFAVSLSWKFDAGLALAALAILAPGLFSARRREIFGAWLIFALATMILRAVPTTRAKPFTRFFLSVHKGMSFAQVQSNFERNFPRNGYFRRPASGWNDGNEIYWPKAGAVASRKLPSETSALQTVSYILDPNDGRYDSEIITIEFRKGRVSHSEYLPD